MKNQPTVYYPVYYPVSKQNLLFCFIKYCALLHHPFKYGQIIYCSDLAESPILDMIHTYMYEAVIACSPFYKVTRLETVNFNSNQFGN